MNNDILKLINNFARINAAAVPANQWKSILNASAMADVHKSIMRPIGMHNMFNHILDNYKALDLKKIFPDSDARTIKGGFFAGENWMKSVGEISSNHFAISEQLAKILPSHPLLGNTFSNIYPDLKGLGGLPSQFGYSAQISILQSTLKGLSSKIVVAGFDGVDHSLLKKFAATTNEAAAITQELAEKDFSTKQDIARLESFIETTLEKFKEDINRKIEKTQKSPFALINLWVSIIGIILTIFTIIQTCQTQQNQNDNSVTQQDIVELKTYVDRKFVDSLKEAAVRGKIKTACNLRSNPSLKSKGFYFLKCGADVHIIDTNHKWVRITIIDSTDSFPITGWVLKKYLISI